MTPEEERSIELLADFDASINSRKPGDFWAAWQDETAVMKWAAKKEDAAIDRYRSSLRKRVEEEREDLDSSDTWQNGYKAACTKVLAILDEQTEKI